MKLEETIILKVYSTSAGRQPFNEWKSSLDKIANSIVSIRISRIRAENFGDYKRIQGCKGIFELRIAHGPGYRIYFGKSGSKIVVLLAGGDKGSQLRDIERAKKYWLDYLGKIK